MARIILTVGQENNLSHAYQVRGLVKLQLSSCKVAPIIDLTPGSVESQ